ncbi:phosphonatase-like hydrolase [Fulvivirga ulvae]|uniref:phosphonatase-like hydrolase n=1 Tax=Fulvivirga ulvae TaxID=2904245 RepID=UPI001F186DF6|nr:phosphonatase-like hydrolase [Fulvivirga ulvae]UII35036.1 phosphonatase-like hydrolase [Fulvivirga ulvae]
MTNIELVVLDMAGTTLNENNIVYKTLHKVINQHGYSVSLKDVLELGAGKEKFQAIKDIAQAFPSDKGEAYEVIFEEFKERLDEEYEKLDVQPTEGTNEFLQFLKANHIKVALNTGYSRRVAQLLIDKLNWQLDEHYDALITADDVVRGRPHADMIFKAMQLLDIRDPKKVLKAGDSAIDIEEGINAKCGITVGVTSGAQTREQLLKANPTYILDKVADIKGLLDNPGINSKST